VCGRRVEGAEGRQLEALPHELLDGDVDQIGRMIHHLGDLMDGHDRRVSRLGAPASDLQVRADLLVVPIHCKGSTLVDVRGKRLVFEPCADVTTSRAPECLHQPVVPRASGMYAPVRLDFVADDDRER
jgi:hypothetical protein